MYCLWGVSIVPGRDIVEFCHLCHGGRSSRHTLWRRLPGPTSIQWKNIKIYKKPTPLILYWPHSDRPRTKVWRVNHFQSNFQGRDSQFIGIYFMYDHELLKTPVPIWKSLFQGVYCFSGISIKISWRSGAEDMKPILCLY